MTREGTTRDLPPPFSKSICFIASTRFRNYNKQEGKRRKQIDALSTYLLLAARWNKRTTLILIFFLKKLAFLLHAENIDEKGEKKVDWTIFAFFEWAEKKLVIAIPLEKGRDGHAGSIP